MGQKRRWGDGCQGEEESGPTGKTRRGPGHPVALEGPVTVVPEGTPESVTTIDPS